MMTGQLATSAPSSARALALGALTGTLVALVGTSVVYLAARGAGLDLIVTAPGQSRGPVPYAALLGAVVVAGTAAFIGALVLRRLRHGTTWFLGSATLVLVVSFASPIGAAEATSTAVVLSAMHVIVAAALVPLLVHHMKGDQK